MQDSPFSRERRQIIDNISSFFSNLFSPDDYEEEVRKVDIALSEYGEWPWQVSLRVREAPGNDGQAVLGDRQVRRTPQSSYDLTTAKLLPENVLVGST